MTTMLMTNNSMATMPCDPPVSVPLLHSGRRDIDGQDDEEQDMERQMEPINQIFTQCGIQATGSIHSSSIPIPIPIAFILMGKYLHKRLDMGRMAVEFFTTVIEMGVNVF
ncbi:hypothetical protein TURU_097140 [Turdus rufiventris]|nr:hypothetical protein TURU_097140 [Turdus rufiventris]